MSDLEIVRRSRLEPHKGSATDPEQDWRRFVLDEVGYDAIARDRTARRADRRRALRRFFGGLLFGLIVFALAFATVIAAREGRFARLMPKKTEAPTPLPLSARWTRTTPPEATEDRDTHVIQQNPFAPPPRPPALPTDPDDDGPADSAPTQDGG
jgi:hypothetical protein